MVFDRRQLGKMNWYRQSGSMKPLTLSYPWLTAIKLTIHGRRIPVYFRNVYGYMKDDFGLLYWPEKSMEQVANYYLKKQEGDHFFIQRLEKWWQRNPRDQFLKIVTELEEQDFTQLNAAQFYSAFRIFSRAYIETWQETLFHDAFDLMGERFLDDYIKKEAVKLPATQLLTLLSSDKPSVLQKEKFDLAELAKVADQHKRLKKLVGMGKLSAIKRDFPSFYRRLVRHSQQYYWKHNDYAHIIRLGPADLLEELRGLLNQDNVWHEILSAKRKFARVKSNKQRLFKRLGLSIGLQSLFTLLSTISKWRDDRKAVNQLGNVFVRKFAKEISRRTGIPQDDLEYGLYWEYKKFFKPTATYRRSLHARSKGGFGYILHPGLKTDIFIGKAAKGLSEFLDRRIDQKGLHGRSAYAGVVSGRVKLILTQKDFYKMKRGDILVAPNTRPEYVPVIKIAAAIISEEGGLTCHTAIVSRELKIPALVGVQGAIAALKDGDRVEVDAVKGIVRKL